MQSWSLQKFVDEYGVTAAAAIWQKSRQTVEQALNAERDIKVVCIDGFYEVHEFKLLGRISFARAIRFMNN